MDGNIEYFEVPDFSTLSGLKTVEQPIIAPWLVSGVSSGIDMGRMSTISGRRDFGPGISGRHAAAEAGTCFLELNVDPQFPPLFSYLITLTGTVRALDLLSAGDAAFSGVYNGENETKSQAIVEANMPFFESGNINLLIRYSAVAYQQRHAREVVYAFLPSATGVLGIQKIEPLGSNSPPVPIRWPDGKIESTSDYCRP